jgi:hypothetical protein
MNFHFEFLSAGTEFYSVPVFLGAGGDGIVQIVRFEISAKCLVLSAQCEEKDGMYPGQVRNEEKMGIK